MKSLYTLIFLALLPCFLQAQLLFKYTKNETYSYTEATESYRSLEKTHPKQCRLEKIGDSDIGQPIYLFVISEDGDFDPASLRKKGKTVLLINNAIHPGEPCGVDASVKLANDLLEDKAFKKILKEVVVCIIPFYNVGGGLNRSCCSRANQNGPTEYGFRGNAQNRDLNRDFIKCDTRNAFAFTKAFQTWNPDVFIDTHTTNGSDFQYVLTLITSQLDKYNPIMANLLRNSLVPDLYKDMAKKEMELIPYVYNLSNTPEGGIKDFLETPRFSTGYATLFNTAAFVTEALKYKPYTDRVEHTYGFLMSNLEWMQKHKKELLDVRQRAIEDVKTRDSFDIAWALDTSTYELIDFKGYETEMQPSSFGDGAELLVYNHDKPFTKKIRYYNKYKATVSVKKPAAYIIPQAYGAVIERLKMNGIEMTRLASETTIAVDMYFIENYETVKMPYEGHYLHYNVKVRREYLPVKFYKGDYVAQTNQVGNRYLVETLEPQAMDAFFAWNFFDGILQQKESFSPFYFEPLAVKLLEEDKYLREAFEQKKKEDADFAKDHYGQLYFIYTHSPYYEPTHNRYPVGRLP